MVALFFNLLMQFALGSSGTTTMALPSVEIASEHEVSEVWCLPSGTVALVTSAGFTHYPLAATGGIVTESAPEGRVFWSGGDTYFMSTPESLPIQLRIPVKEWDAGVGPFVSPDLKLMISDRDPMRGLRVFATLDSPEFKVRDLPLGNGRTQLVLWIGSHTVALNTPSLVTVIDFSDDGSLTQVIKIDSDASFLATDSHKGLWALRQDLDAFEVVNLTLGVSQKISHVKLELGTYVTDFKVLGSKPLILLSNGKIISETGEVFVMNPQLNQGEVAKRFCAVRHGNIVRTSILASNGLKTVLYRSELSE